MLLFIHAIQFLTSWPVFLDCNIHNVTYKPTLLIMSNVHSKTASKIWGMSFMWLCNKIQHSINVLFKSAFKQWPTLLLSHGENLWHNGCPRYNFCTKTIHSHIFTTAYNQVLICTSEWIGAPQWERKYPSFKMAAKRIPTQGPSIASPAFQRWAITWLSCVRCTYTDSETFMRYYDRSGVKLNLHFAFTGQTIEYIVHRLLSI